MAQAPFNLPQRNYSNTHKGTRLSAALPATANDTIQLESLDGLPSAPFVLVVDRDDPAKAEAIQVDFIDYGVSPPIVYCFRGHDGTPIVAHDVGAKVTHDHTAADYKEPREAIRQVNDRVGALERSTESAIQDLTPGASSPRSRMSDTYAPNAGTTTVGLSVPPGRRYILKQAIVHNEGFDTTSFAFAVQGPASLNLGFQGAPVGTGERINRGETRVIEMGVVLNENEQLATWLATNGLINVTFVYVEAASGPERLAYLSQAASAWTTVYTAHVFYPTIISSIWAANQAPIANRLELRVGTSSGPMARLTSGPYGISQWSVPIYLKPGFPLQFRTIAADSPIAMTLSGLFVI